MFGDDYLAREETVAFPRIGVGGRAVAHGRFAFFSGDGTQRFVLVRTDASSGLLTPDAVVLVAARPPAAGGRRSAPRLSTAHP